VNRCQAHDMSSDLSEYRGVGTAIWTRLSGSGRRRPKRCGDGLARTGDVFAYFRAPVPWLELARRTVAEIFDDGCPGLAAQLAFYFFLALFPALLVLVTLIAQLPIQPAVAAALDRMQGFLPQDVLSLMRHEIDRLTSGDHNSLLTFGIAGAVWSSSSAMTAVISTLNRAYDLEEMRPWWQTRLIAIALTLALSAFVIAAFTLVVGGADLGAAVAEWIGAGDVFRRFWSIAQWPVALALVVVAVDLVYHFAPNAETRWVWVTPGSLLATALWLLASAGFKLYVLHFANFAVVYGAIGSVIVLLLWFYLSGFAILVGAELNSEIDHALPTRDESPQIPHRRRKIGAAAEAAAHRGR
jgi:membrane protein